MLVTMDLPTPAQMRGRLAAFAAICGAQSRERRGCFADGPLWHFDDWGGNWAELHHDGGGRVVMVGNDHEYSETHYGPFAQMFSEPETDLLAGAPQWWAPYARQVIAGGERLGFVYGFDGAWRRADYDLYDGFASVGIPALDDAHCVELVSEFAKDARTGAPDPAAIEALIAADADVTAAQVAAVIGDKWDAAAGAAAARAFLAVELA
ncbi:hypothetical protein [Catellatospora vulcania]|uniref:hypothetical protein n=1 Tax=Catellatospora vulcania TaxID=1460450 RepID=UPI001E2C11A7|nr:hypothetical protein [Catellatospora vulcania]